MDAGALDDLDLDGMFADDGDMLFDGLEMDLGGDMGDIMSTDKNNAAPPPPVEPPPEVPPAPIAKRAGGPRTKRTNPMLESANTITSVPKEDSSAAAKRRKTKRKSKAPAAFDDEDFVVEEEPPKKKRKATTKGKKPGEPVVATTKTKRKKTTASGSLVKPSNPMAASTTGVTKSTKASMLLPTSSVAAAGQFGGRLKKVGTTKVKRKLKKSDGTIDPATLAPAEVIKPPKPEPTFGGLAPSKTLFYPFLESVPVESTMQKRKTYPVMDKLSSALTSQILASPDTAPFPSVNGLTEESAVFKLMADTYDGAGSEKDKNNFPREKKDALLRGIFHLRKMVHKTDKNTVVKDIFAMCGLLTREYNFLKQTLDNMKVWCKNEFDNDKYKETYEPPLEKPKITKWKCSSGIVRVKITCTGYKEPKNTPPLFAVLPAMVYDSAAARPLSSPGTPSSNTKGISANDTKKAGSTVVTGVSSPKGATATITKKKKVEKPSEKSKIKGSPASSQVPATPVPKTYADSTPIARRQQIVERVSQLALELESLQHKEQTIGKLDPIPEEQPPLHTNRMWEWLQAAGFYDKVASSKRLASIKAPTIHARRQLRAIPPTILGHDAENSEDEGEEKETRVSSCSLFDRLQSLLVEVDDDDEGDDDDSEDDSEDEDSLGFLDEDDDDSDVADIESKIKAVENGELSKDTKFDVADVSELSIEERTFIQLARAGLIKKKLYPKTELCISNHKDEGNTEEVDETEGFNNVIGEMSNDLTRISTMNNKRIAFIERLTSNADVYYNKQVEEQQAVLIAKCQNLMKRTKEKAKKAKQKKDENLNLPW